jgi:hypothetical protein
MRTALFLTAILAPMPALALIDLDFRPDRLRVQRGDNFNLQLFAVSDNNQNQSIGALDVVLKWDPRKVRLTGYTNQGNGYNWFAHGWLYNDGPNRDRTDGDAIWTAIARPGQPAFATMSGLLVTTFQFTVVRGFRQTWVSIDPGEEPYITAVYDGFVPGLNVTGRLDPGVEISSTDLIGFVPRGMPEPATWLALSAGLALMARKRRQA